MQLLFVCLGGAVGSGGRYLVSSWTAPNGTLIVNLVGSFVIGAIMQAQPKEDLRLLLVVGVLGGFTTFSSFSYETVALFQKGATGTALINVAASVVGCLLATAAGVFLVSHVKA